MGINEPGKAPLYLSSPPSNPPLRGGGLGWPALESNGVFIHFFPTMRFKYESRGSSLQPMRVKDELHLNLKEVLTLADEDIKKNWKAYQRTFMEGK
jgi:hypothetical protein